ncbi:MAG: TIGR03915 family putative DNA repair protein [Treponema sp.]|jgi:hypothetical protein|nr:TIGR03915 family putative DNA repair protein [Treponema sp.]
MKQSNTERNSYDGSLYGLFTLLETFCGETGETPAKSLHEGCGLWYSQGCSSRREASGQRELFVFSEPETPPEIPPEPCLARPSFQGDLFREYQDALELPLAKELYGYSVSAHDGFVHGWMSELPIEAELIRYARRVITAARTAPRGAGRYRAEQAALDRGDPVVRTVLEAASKVTQEIHRLTGFLRFSPHSGGSSIAHCEPDYFALPALAFHFSRRFGETSWKIIDKRRSLCLAQTPKGEIRLFPLTGGAEEHPEDDPWEALWRNYHRSINNESRNNPALQRQFMPKRYWKYLPEVD